MTAVVGNAAAGRLDSFERSVKKEAKHSSSSSRSSSNSGPACVTTTVNKETGKTVTEDCFAGLGLAIFRGTFGSIYLGGAYSFHRIIPFLEDFRPAPRKMGKPVIPFARLDMGYQSVGNTVNATGYRLEVGFGPFAFNYSETQYTEELPEDSLKVTRAYGAYRMSLGSYVEVDVGVGSLTVDGNKRNSYTYLTLPILIHPPWGFGFEFRPAQAANIEEYDLSILWHLDFSSLNIGYRWLKAGDVSLNGPYAAFSIYF